MGRGQEGAGAVGLDGVHDQDVQRRSFERVLRSAQPQLIELVTIESVVITPEQEREREQEPYIRSRSRGQEQEREQEQRQGPRLDPGRSWDVPTPSRLALSAQFRLSGLKPGSGIRSCSRRRLLCLLLQNTGTLRLKPTHIANTSSRNAGSRSVPGLCFRDQEAIGNQFLFSSGGSVR